jgi:hypothetical protein
LDRFKSYVLSHCNFRCPNKVVNKLTIFSYHSHDNTRNTVISFVLYNPIMLIINRFLA